MLTTKVQQDGIAIVEPSRNVIGEAVDELRQALMHQIDRSSKPRIVVDFGGVSKMDSSGLGTFINVYSLAKAKQGRIGVINVGKNIKSLIVRSRLINYFEHFESESAAVSALAGIR